MIKENSSAPTDQRAIRDGRSAIALTNYREQRGLASQRCWRKLVDTEYGCAPNAEEKEGRPAVIKHVYEEKSVIMASR